MDPTLAALTLQSRVWVICERHKVARRGLVVTVSVEAITVRLPNSKLPPQRYDRQTGMRIFGVGPQRTNDFFIRTELPPRYLTGEPYVIVDETEEVADVAA